MQLLTISLLVYLSCCTLCQAEDNNDIQKRQLVPDAGENPFWRDAETAFHFRSFGMDRDREHTADSQAWAAGGILRFTSGWWRQRLQLAAGGYGSLGLLSPDDKPGTQLLTSRQHSITTLGEANATIKLTPNSHLKLGRQTLDLPFINADDARMVPNAHEAYLLDIKPSADTDWLLGFISRIKRRDRERFIWMSAQAGASGSRGGLALAHLRHRFSAQTEFMISNQHSLDLYNNLYAEFKTAFKLMDNLPLKFSVQGTYQRATGAKRLGDFNTNSFGMLLNTDYLGFGWSLAATTTAENTQLLRPYGVTPSYLSLIVQDFDRPGEDAVMFGLSYDFSRIGINNLSGFTKFVRSWTPDTGRFASPDQSELNVTLDYHFKKNLLEGLWLRLRYAKVEQYGVGANDMRDFHIILNYSLPLGKIK